MNKFSLFALALGGLLAQPAAAFEVLGGSVALSFDKTDDIDIKRSKLAGSIELGFGGKVSAQIDAVAHRFDTFSTSNGTSFAVHGIYRINPDFAVGVFVGRQDDDGFNFGKSNFYGLEGAYQIGKVDVQAYYGRTKPVNFAIDFDIYGLSADYAINDKWAVGLKYDVLDLGFFSFKNTALRGTYSMANNVSLFAEVGKADFGQDDPFFGVGVSYGFGANKKATFNPRGSTATLGGF